MSESSWMWAALGLVAWVGYFGSWGWYVAGAKGREPIEGAVMGLLGGPMGLVLAALLPESKPAPKIAAGTAPPAVPRTARKLMGEVGE